jgi:hypothetical protein
VYAFIHRLLLLFVSLSSEEDIVDGTGKIKRALLEIFFELDKQRGEKSLLKEQPPSVLTSMVDPSEDTFL